MMLGLPVMSVPDSLFAEVMNPGTDITGKPKPTPYATGTASNISFQFLALRAFHSPLWYA
jgi:hypothetical protein